MAETSKTARVNDLQYEKNLLGSFSQKSIKIHVQLLAVYGTQYLLMTTSG